MNQRNMAEIFAQMGGCTVLEQEPMRKHTTFRIGGPAQFFVKAETVQALSAVRKYCAREGIPCMVVGRGSNLLVSDTGIRGVVIQLCGEMETIRREKNDIVCGAGVSLAALAKFALEEGLTGAEFLWGIPGAVGGAVYMNAGAYGGEIGQILVSADHVEPDGTIKTLTGEEIGFGYRKTIYHESDAVITSVRLRLTPGEKSAILATMEELMGRRKDKQPLEYPSAGSVFKRPEGHFAGALIEQCHLKGFTIGGAQVSEKHAGFIINIGNATCADVEALIAQIQKVVLENTGVALECEIKTVE